MAIDFNRGTSGVLLPSTVSQEIWQGVQEQSIVAQRARTMALPGGGVDIPIITGDPTAEWVSETDAKPVSRGTVGSKNIKGYTLAVIVPFSNQFKRDVPGLYSALVGRLPGVLAKKLDRTALGFDASPGTGFDTLAAAPSVDISDPNTYKGFLQAIGSVAQADNADVTGWVLSTQGELAALGATDTAKRPLLITDIQREGSVGNVLARPVYKSQHVNGGGVVGFGGDWDSALLGWVETLKIDISEQATIQDGATSLNLWQRNMFAVRVEFEVGFAVRDAQRFVKLTDGPAGS